jgi:hypothetical protein
MLSQNPRTGPRSPRSNVKTALTLPSTKIIHPGVQPNNHISITTKPLTPGSPESFDEISQLKGKIVIPPGITSHIDSQGDQQTPTSKPDRELITRQIRELLGKSERSPTVNPPEKMSDMSKDDLLNVIDNQQPKLGFHDIPPTKTSDKPRSPKRVSKSIQPQLHDSISLEYLSTDTPTDTIMSTFKNHSPQSQQSTQVQQHRLPTIPHPTQVQPPTTHHTQQTQETPQIEQTSIKQQTKQQTQETPQTEQTYIKQQMKQQTQETPQTEQTYIKQQIKQKTQETPQTEQISIKQQIKQQTQETPQIEQTSTKQQTKQKTQETPQTEQISIKQQTQETPQTEQISIKQQTQETPQTEQISIKQQIKQQTQESSITQVQLQQNSWEQFTKHYSSLLVEELRNGYKRKTEGDHLSLNWDNPESIDKAYQTMILLGREPDTISNSSRSVGWNDLVIGKKQIQVTVTDTYNVSYLPEPHLMSVTLTIQKVMSPKQISEIMEVSSDIIIDRGLSKLTVRSDSYDHCLCLLAAINEYLNRTLTLNETREIYYQWFKMTIRHPEFMRSALETLVFY